MREATQRAIARWIHILSGITVIGYVYTPFEALPGFAHLVRYIFLPVMVIAGLWMWKGHVVRRMFAPASRRT